MSDKRFGYDFNHDGKISFTESHLTYDIMRKSIGSPDSSCSDGKPPVSVSATGEGSRKKPNFARAVIIYFLILGLILAIPEICVSIDYKIKYDKVVSLIEEGKYLMAYGETAKSYKFDSSGMRPLIKILMMDERSAGFTDYDQFDMALLKEQLAIIGSNYSGYKADYIKELKANCESIEDRYNNFHYEKYGVRNWSGA